MKITLFVQRNLVFNDVYSLWIRNTQWEYNQWEKIGLFGVHSKYKLKRMRKLDS